MRISVQQSLTFLRSRRSRTGTPRAAAQTQRAASIALSPICRSEIARPAATSLFTLSGFSKTPLMLPRLRKDSSGRARTPSAAQPQSKSATSLASRCAGSAEARPQLAQADIRDCKDIQTPLTGDSRRFQRACQHGTRNQGESRTSGRSRRRAVPPSRAGKAPTEQSSGR